MQSVYDTTCLRICFRGGVGVSSFHGFTDSWLLEHIEINIPTDSVQIHGIGCDHDFLHYQIDSFRLTPTIPKDRGVTDCTESIFFLFFSQYQCYHLLLFSSSCKEFTLFLSGFNFNDPSVLSLVRLHFYSAILSRMFFVRNYLFEEITFL